MIVIVQVKDLQKFYDNGFIVLKGVNFDIEEGEIFVLLGLNGVGKIMLILLICGIFQLIGGIIYVGGYDVVKDY